MWIDTKALSAIVGKSQRAIQLKARNGEIAARKKDGRSIEVDTDSLPPEWKALIAVVPSVPSVRESSPLSAYAEGILGRKLTGRESRKVNIARYADSLGNVPESRKVAMTAGYFGLSESTVRRAIKEVSEYGVVSADRKPSGYRAWDDEAVSYLRSYYLQLAKDRNIDSKEAAWKALQSEAQRRNWKIGSRSSAFRILKDIPVLIRQYATGGNRALDNFFYIKRDWSSIEPAAILIDRCIVFFGRIHVLMAEHVGDQINIPGLLIERCAVCTAELVRGDLFIRSDLLCVLLHHIFYSLYAHPFPAGGEEERVLMAGKRHCCLPCRVEISLQRIFNLFAKIYDHFIPAFSRHLDSVVFEIHILYIETYALGDADSRAEQESKYRQITVFRLLIIGLSLPGQIVSSMVYIVKQLRNFIRIQTYDRLFMELRHIHKKSRILRYDLPFEEIAVEASQSRHFSGEPLLCVCDLPAVVFINLQIFLVFFDIDRLQALQILNGKLIRCIIFI